MVFYVYLHNKNSIIIVVDENPRVLQKSSNRERNDNESTRKIKRY